MSQRFPPVSGVGGVGGPPNTPQGRYQQPPLQQSPAAGPMRPYSGPPQNFTVS